MPGYNVIFVTAPSEKIGTTGGLSHVDYILEDNQLFLDVQVNQI